MHERPPSSVSVLLGGTGGLKVMMRMPALGSPGVLITVSQHSLDVPVGLNEKSSLNERAVRERNKVPMLESGDILSES